MVDIFIPGSCFKLNSNQSGEDVIFRLDSLLAGTRIVVGVVFQRLSRKLLVSSQFRSIQMQPKETIVFPCRAPHPCHRGAMLMCRLVPCLMLTRVSYFWLLVLRRLLRSKTEHLSRQTEWSSSWLLVFSTETYSSACNEKLWMEVEQRTGRDAGDRQSLTSAMCARLGHSCRHPYHCHPNSKLFLITYLIQTNRKRIPKSPLVLSLASDAASTIECSLLLIGLSRKRPRQMCVSRDESML
jgi:hypothetical protein